MWSGRATRPEYWYFFLFTVAVWLVTAVLDSALGLEFDQPAVTGDRGLLGLLSTLVLFLPGLAVSARRLHDIGRSAWWMLIALIPCVGLVVLIVFAATAGQPYANQYGERPIPGRP